MKLIILTRNFKVILSSQVSLRGLKQADKLFSKKPQVKPVILCKTAVSRKSLCHSQGIILISSRARYIYDTRPYPVRINGFCFRNIISHVFQPDVGNRNLVARDCHIYFIGPSVDLGYIFYQNTVIFGVGCNNIPIFLKSDSSIKSLSVKFLPIVPSAKAVISVYYDLIFSESAGLPVFAIKPD